MLVLLSTATAWSAEEQRSGNGDKPAAQAAHVQAFNARAAGKSEGDRYIESIEKTANLTDAQKKSIQDIFAARGKAINDFQTKNAEKLSAASRTMMDARKDKEAWAKAQKEYQELYAPLYEAIKEANEQLLKVLTPEQKARQKEYHLTLMVKGMASGVELSNAQMKAMKDILAARDKALEDFYAKNAEKLNAASRAMMDAAMSKDKEALAKAQKAQQEIYAPCTRRSKRRTRDCGRSLRPRRRPSRRSLGLPPRRRIRGRPARHNSSMKPPPR